MKKFFSLMLLAAVAICSTACDDTEDVGYVSIGSGSYIGTTTAYDRYDAMAFANAAQDNEYRTQVVAELLKDNTKNTLDFAIEDVQLSTDFTLGRVSMKDLDADDSIGGYSLDSQDVYVDGFISYTLTDMKVVIEDGHIVATFKVSGVVLDDFDEYTLGYIEYRTE
ncbi:MAG: hypothetical protein SNH88_00455 [Rikenellaceae bacterium]